MLAKRTDAFQGAMATARQRNRRLIDTLWCRLFDFSFVVCRGLALVCLMRAECWQASGLVEYNFTCFKDAISRLLEVKSRLVLKSALPAAQQGIAHSSASALPPQQQQQHAK